MVATGQLAIRSKNPGDTDDYRVLAFSPGPLAAAELKQAFAALNVGTLPPEPKHPGAAAPWLTFGACASGAGPSLVAVRQEWAGHGDGHNARPVVAQLLLALPYEPFASLCPDFLSLARQIPPHGRFLPDSAGRLATVELAFAPAAGRLAAWAALVDPADDKAAEVFEFHAAVAALMLQAPVVLTSGDQMGSEERLHRLDAIASLLPYGVRADLFVSTWVLGASVHRVRLGFGDAPSFNQVGVRWGETPRGRLTPGSEAERYYRLLLALRERRSALHVISKLAGITSPFSFQAPAAIVQALEEIDRSHQVWVAVQASRRDPSSSPRQREVVAAVRRLFRSGEAAELEPTQQLDCLRCLLADFKAEDGELLGRHWQPALLPELAQAAQAALVDGERWTAELQALAGVAAQVGRQRETLMALLGYSAGLAPGGGRRAAQAALAALARDWLPGLSSGDGRLRELLANGNRPVLYGAAMSLAEADRLPELRALCETMGPGELGLLALQVGSGLLDRSVAQEAVATLAEDDPGWLRSLVEIAGRRPGREPLRRLLPAVVGWLVDHLEALADGERREWATLLPRLALAAEPAPRLQAQLDALYLLLLPGSPPPFVPEQLVADAAASAEYVGEVRRLVEARPLLGGAFVRGFAQHADQRRLAGEAEVANALAVLARLSPLAAGAAERTLLHETVLELGRAYPLLLWDEGFARYWRQQLIQAGHGPAVAALELRAGLDVSTPIDRAAEICAAVVTGLPGGEAALATALAEKGYVRDLAGLRAFLAVLERQLAQRAVPSAERQRLTATLADAALAGHLTPGLAADYRQALVDEAVADLEQAVATVNTLRAHLDEADRRRLRAALRRAGRTPVQTPLADRLSAGLRRLLRRQRAAQP